jgi:predicted nucleotidyltransferase
MATNPIPAIPVSDRILATLRHHAPELQAAGVAHLRLFGSVARGEATPASDIDLLADFTPGKRISLITLGGLEVRLTNMLGNNVEVACADSLKPHIRERVLQEAVVAF